jgi:hypothetical protein
MMQEDQLLRSKIGFVQRELKAFRGTLPSRRNETMQGRKRFLSANEAEY